ncbi:unannotated protein [freshwater metagenome]|uniref:Unannotated protein n=1 Tax=freshwater metagenome TaxID=449393 RepID=A0A6J7EUL9_9ZZZZ
MRNGLGHGLVYRASVGYVYDDWQGTLTKLSAKVHDLLQPDIRDDHVCPAPNQLS